MKRAVGAVLLLGVGALLGGLCAPPSPPVAVYVQPRYAIQYKDNFVPYGTYAMAHVSRWRKI